MSSWMDVETLPFFAAAAAAALAVASLATHRGDRHPPWAQIGAGLLAVMAALVARPACQDFSSPIDWSPWIPIAVYVVFFPATDAGILHVLLCASRLITPPRVRLGMLVLLLILLAHFALVSEEAALSRPKADDVFVLRDPKGVFVPAPNLVTTDSGRRIDVSEAAFPSLASMKEESLRKQTAILERLGLLGVVIPVVQGWQHSNCHGWVFTGGRFWVDSVDVQHILDDNGYQLVQVPLAGDLCIYRSPSGEVTHSGIVRIVTSGFVLVESKWGRLGRFLHPHDRQPYVADRPSFHRTTRLGGHFLRGSPAHESLPFPPLRFLEKAYPSPGEQVPAGI